MSNNEHLTVSGLQQIVNINASMNLSSSDFIKSNFKINPVDRKFIQTTTIPDPYWISGFVSGDGNFDAGIRKATENRNSRVYLRFRISQHEKDIKLMELIIKYFGVGRIEKNNRTNAFTVNLVIGNFANLTQIIIPFFNQYSILGIKHLDYLDWCKIANLITLEKT